jgi:ASC-1-like (ASCH) protein
MGKKLTITLTDRRPVTVDVDVWPVIAKAKDWDNQHESQANRTWMLTVRQCHTDGGDAGDRCIVYGVYDTAWQNESGKRGGEIVDTLDEVPAAVKRVAKYLGFEERLADECIADLPADEI